MSKVKLDVIKPWITTKITQILGIEDDVVVEFVYNQLEEKVRPINSSLIILTIRTKSTLMHPSQINRLTRLFPLIIRVIKTVNRRKKNKSNYLQHKCITQLRLTRNCEKKYVNILFNWNAL